MTYFSKASATSSKPCEVTPFLSQIMVFSLLFICKALLNILAPKSPNWLPLESKKFTTYKYNNVYTDSTHDHVYDNFSNFTCKACQQNIFSNLCYQYKTLGVLIDRLSFVYLSIICPDQWFQMTRLVLRGYILLIIIGI